MKTYPDAVNRAQKKKVAKLKEPSKAIQITALIIAFISVYYFFIKLLFL